MHGTEHRGWKPPGVSPRCSTAAVYRLQFQCSGSRRKLRFLRGRSLASAFPSPATTAVFLSAHSGVNGPSLMLRHLARRSRRPFGVWLHHQNRFAPVLAASSPNTRYGLYDPRCRTLTPLPLPFRRVTSLRIKAFCGTASGKPAFRFARSPFAPRCRSITSFGFGSSFPVRYVSATLQPVPPPACQVRTWHFNRPGNFPAPLLPQGICP
jgi:hypothetical protein